MMLTEFCMHIYRRNGETGFREALGDKERDRERERERQIAFYGCSWPPMQNVLKKTVRGG